MATNRMMTDAEQTRIESIDERARIKIWSGSQVIASSGIYNFFSTLLFPISSGYHIKVKIAGYETVSELEFEDIIRLGNLAYSSGSNVSIQCASSVMNIRNDLAVEIHITSIYLYLN